MPELDPLAVSVVVIKSLSMLACPLLDAAVPMPDGSLVPARDELLDAALCGASYEVWVAMIHHVLINMPEAQGAMFQVSCSSLQGAGGGVPWVAWRAWRGVMLSMGLGLWAVAGISRQMGILAAQHTTPLFLPLLLPCSGWCTTWCASPGTPAAAPQRAWRW